MQLTTSDNIDQYSYYKNRLIYVSLDKTNNFKNFKTLKL